MAKGRNNQQERQEFTLQELNNRIKGVLTDTFTEAYWVRAEMSDVRANVTSGHCYLEFIEKNSLTGQIMAKARGNIWAKTFRMLKPYFEMETGQLFSSGLKVLVKVIVEFHEVYGFSLTVVDIDPAYTLGDMMRRRMEIIRQLQEEGVYTLNKELPFPMLPKRIAIITSPTAAGYEDFLNQLVNNKRGYTFYTKLFPAVMQGEKTEDSIVEALEHIYQELDSFDLVVIIRGGGATSELNSFDSYLLAANCAQFPLPIITGIGHERDDTIVDMVAHTRMKTPTAVAEFLIHQLDVLAIELEDIQQLVTVTASSIIQEQKTVLQVITNRLPVVVLSRIEQHRSFLQTVGNRIPVASFNLLSQNRNTLQRLQLNMQQYSNRKIADESQFLGLTEQYLKMASPEYILKKGYSLTLKDGKIVKSAANLVAGDDLTVKWMDGEVMSKVVKSDIYKKNR